MNVTNPLSYAGKVIIVTGGSRGIGNAIAKRYLEFGGRVIITGTADSHNVRDGLEYHCLDCSNRESVKSFTKFITQMARLDVLVNNAGVNKINLLPDIDPKDFDSLYEINLRAPFLLSQAAAKVMANGGHILNVASIWSTVSRAGRISYISSKSGVTGLTRGLATDLAPQNILVNTLSPGFVGTELTYTSLSPTEIEELTKNIPIGRLAEPSEIADQAVFITSSMNTYMTGRNIIVDGGFTNV